jgi:hypothetical protein
MQEQMQGGGGGGGGSGGSTPPTLLSSLRGDDEDDGGDIWAAIDQTQNEFQDAIASNPYTVGNFNSGKGIW